MDQDLKELIEKLRQQQEGFQVVGSPTVEEQSMMEPPRPDYSNAIAPSKKYSKIIEHVQPNSRSQIPSEQISPAAKEFSNDQVGSIQAINDSLHGSGFNSAKQIDNLKKLFGSK